MNKASRGPPSAQGEVQLEAAWSELSDSLVEPSFFSDQARSRSRGRANCAEGMSCDETCRGRFRHPDLVETNHLAVEPYSSVCLLRIRIQTSQDLPARFAEKYW